MLYDDLQHHNPEWQLYAPARQWIDDLATLMLGTQRQLEEHGPKAIGKSHQLVKREGLDFDPKNVLVGSDEQTVRKVVQDLRNDYDLVMEPAATGADPGLGAALTRSAHFRCPAHLLLPGGRPETAALEQVIALGQLAAPRGAAKDRAAVAIDAIAEVLAGHADAGSFPVAQLVRVHKVPVLHTHARCSTPVLLVIGGVGKWPMGACRAKRAPLVEGCPKRSQISLLVDLLGGRSRSGMAIVRDS